LELIAIMIYSCVLIIRFAWQCRLSKAKVT
jgi:hypothetical protein